MKRSVESMLSETIFKDIKLTPNWIKALEKGTTEFFSEGSEVLTYYIEDDILVINSGSVGDKAFNMSIFKQMIRLIETHDKVIISSTAKKAKRFMKKKGFRYNEELKAYLKGV